MGLSQGASQSRSPFSKVIHATHYAFGLAGRDHIRGIESRKARDQLV